MQNDMEIILSGANIKTREDFHEEIKKAIDLPKYYGENLDALWDCLTALRYPLTLIWEDYAVSKCHLGDFADRISTVLEEAQKTIPGFVLIYR